MYCALPGIKVRVLPAFGARAAGGSGASLPRAEAGSSRRPCRIAGGGARTDVGGAGGRWSTLSRTR